MLVFPDRTLVGTVGGGAIEAAVIEEALLAMIEDRPRRYSAVLTQDLGMCCGGKMEVFVDPIEARPTLWIYGAGHVAKAVCPIAVALDFDVHIVDDRDDLATQERFLGATVHRTDPRRWLDTAAISDEDWHLVVTHDHALDQDLCGALLPRPCAFLGLIGSRAKAARFFERWTAQGIDPTLFSRLSSPVGLDVGAETPTEIAVAIAAELVRVRRNADRSPEPLAHSHVRGRGSYRPPAWVKKDGR